LRRGRIVVVWNRAPITRILLGNPDAPSKQVLLTSGSRCDNGGKAGIRSNMEIFLKEELSAMISMHLVVRVGFLLEQPPQDLMQSL
jgi:hypothetical protein